MPWPFRRRSTTTAVQPSPSAPVGVASRFEAAWWADNESDPIVLELLPTRLAQAAARVLGVDGAGISILDGDFRIPLGASDDAASHAERLQFVAGEGPCLQAAWSRRSIAVDRKDMQDRWPIFADQLMAQTSYQAIIAVPVGDSDDLSGALDLYLTDPERLDSIPTDDVRLIAEQIHNTLLETAVVGPGPVSGQPEPTWIHGDTAQDRLSVWIAVGEIMASLDVSASDGLDLIRGRAFARNETVEQTARALTDGTIAVDDITR